MAIATLESIIKKVRKFAGLGSTLEKTDAEIIDYINAFYLYTFPAQFRSLKLKDIYTFNTYRGIDTYPFDSEHFTTVEMPCYCLDRQISLDYNPGSFYALSTNWQQQENLATGDGTVGPYSGTIQVAPIIRSVNNNPKVSDTLSATNQWPAGRPLTFNQAVPGRIQNLLISADINYGNTVHVTDNGGNPDSTSVTGSLIGDCVSGTINYETGEVTNLVFSQAIPSGYDIRVQAKPANMNFPLYILFYQNQLVLRPVPDKGYTITLVAYRQPSQALLGSNDPQNPALAGTPELLEWWEAIAAGAAKKIYQERLDSDGMALMENILQDNYAAIEARTYAQLGSQRIMTIYAPQLEGYGNGNIIFNNNSGVR